MYAEFKQSGVSTKKEILLTHGRLYDCFEGKREHLSKVLGDGPTTDRLRERLQSTYATIPNASQRVVAFVISRELASRGMSPRWQSCRPTYDDVHVGASTDENERAGIKAAHTLMAAALNSYNKVDHRV
jgi:hypothetical protein